MPGDHEINGISISTDFNGPGRSRAVYDYRCDQSIQYRRISQGAIGRFDRLQHSVHGTDPTEGNSVVGQSIREPDHGGRPLRRRGR
ncbi:hypothetical protein [Nocardia australiensis]|uniref:hypothetical protein n=1 Tax=Nocardia australiensis TaxID=2887191 RepID=UPI001D14B779|nr:hypothetical protein [Nocardia australiensis]